MTDLVLRLATALLRGRAGRWAEPTGAEKALCIATTERSEQQLRRMLDPHLPVGHDGRCLRRGHVHA